MDYILKPVPGAHTSSFDWANDPFYTSAVVLGIDIGIEGIGIWLRKGRTPIFPRTLLFNTPEAAPLKGRRLLRGGPFVNVSGEAGLGIDGTVDYFTGTSPLTGQVVDGGGFTAGFGAGGGASGQVTGTKIVPIWPWPGNTSRECQ
jgi:hypothetical protein